MNKCAKKGAKRPTSVRAKLRPARQNNDFTHGVESQTVCSSEGEVREQIRLTVMHELGHCFGMDENQLKTISRKQLILLCGSA